MKAVLRSSPARDLLLAVSITLISFAVYVLSPVLQSVDSRWTLHVAQSLILEGNVDLDEYHDRGLISADDYRITHVGGHVYSFFPIGTPLLAVIPLALYRGSAPGAGPGVLSPFFEMRVASAIVSLCAFVIYYIGRIHLDRPSSFLVALVFAFCTPAWSTASRALWQHGPSMLMLSLALYLVLMAEDRPRWIQFAGLPLAYAYVIRPTNSIPAACLSVYVLIRHRKYLPGFLALAMLVAVPFFTFNWATYHSLLPPYYMPERIGTNRAFFQAMAANLVSPARGLFVYSPVFLASVAGVFLKHRAEGLSKLDVALLAILGLHLIAVSSFEHWWGGHSYGPRFLTDMIPYLVYFLVAAVARMSGFHGAVRYACTVCLAVLVLASVLIHGRGAAALAAYAWNYEPVGVDRAPSRLWDWRDVPFLRGIVPQVVAQPDRVYVLRQSSDQREHEVAVELDELSHQPFRWRASAPAGVVVSPTRGDAAVHYRLSIAVPWEDHPPGKYSLGAVHIRAARSGRIGGLAVRKSLPVELCIVEDSTSKAFLPLVLRDDEAIGGLRRR